MGYTTSVCTRCGQSGQTDFTEALGHSYTGQKVRVEPKCEETGYEGIKCCRCDDVKIENVLPAIDHEAEVIPAKSATCTEPGNTVGTRCKLCKKELLVPQVTPKLGHSFTDYKSDNNATNDADTKTAKCDRDGCNATDTVADEGSILFKNGWKSLNGKWYYYKNGFKQTGWLQIGGTWYYFKSSGAMTTGWLQIGGTWYYFKSSGAMTTGWLQQGSTWYYFHSSGAMATGSVKVGNKTYSFSNSGACLNP